MLEKKKPSQNPERKTLKGPDDDDDDDEKVCQQNKSAVMQGYVL
jgi:hypothetical protein